MSLLQAMRRHARFRAREVAMIEGETQHDWRRFEDRVLRLAEGLRSLGVGRGDRIGILALNSRAYLEAECAIWAAGAVIVPMNIRWSTAENGYAIEDSNIRVLFADRNFLTEAELLRTARDDLLIVGIDAEGAAGDVVSEQLIKASDRAPEYEPAPKDLAGIFYTGGTTGRSKGVMLSHGAMWINSISVAMATGIGEEDRLLHTAPLFHVAGGIMLQAGLVSGSTHIFMPRFVADQLVRNVEQQKVTKLLILPTMVQMMMEDKTYAPAKLQSLNGLLFGGSPMPEPILARLKEDLPQVSLVHTYGQTEMGPAISFLHPRWQFVGSPKGLSVGTPFTTVEVKVVDADGHPVALGEVGEIWARGPGQMTGYLNKPEETAKAITEDGWVRTGDIAYQDEDGFLYICDRAKDMIITGGENVFSGEVENVILRHPAVREAAVVGIPDDEYGEAVHAVLVLHEGAEIELQALRDHCRAEIAPYKSPRSLEIRATLPLSPTGKVLKRDLRAPFWENRSTAV
ncbi:long-chain acyl-CoA synthetase [Sphingopyxis panaciterrae]|uniref:class I adenylate-forming enzyme family protein n=1 Tax=Sphingopyxis panaciterrae TaxID=363841 RepID=UPI0014232759|nr:AMP-binding protein [Sphingopyxis panaciterrae]NIJ37541.1 long-chain acyl-CoA synthetase [Sphingopyxis panaciterrae]